MGKSQNQPQLFMTNISPQWNHKSPLKWICLTYDHFWNKTEARWPLGLQLKNPQPRDKENAENDTEKFIQKSFW